MRSRRVKMYRVGRTTLFNSLLRTGGEYRLGVAHPADARVVEVYHNPLSNSFDFVVESESFPEVAECDPIPEERVTVTVHEHRVPTLKVGDAVRLKGGGPGMVVVARGDGSARCLCQFYSDREGSFMREEFLVTSLVAHDGDAA